MTTATVINFRHRARIAVIRVAQDLLETEGPRGWTVRAAARIAGVSSGAPYRHFADKDALLAAVAARGFDELKSEIDARIARASASPLSRFQALGEAYVSFALARPGRYSIMFGRTVAFHGKADQRIPFADGEATVRALHAQGYRATLQAFEGVGHSIPMAMRAGLYAALRKLTAPPQ